MHTKPTRSVMGFRHLKILGKVEILYLDRTVKAHATAKYAYMDDCPENSGRPSTIAYRSLPFISYNFMFCLE